MNGRVVPCWAFRYEDLGYADSVDALIALAPDALDRLVIASGRAIPEGEERWDWLDVLGDMCVCDEGHAGEHRFAPQDEITLTFVVAVAS